MAKEDDAAQQFAKDFGNLGKFLAGITQYASALPGARGDRMRQLVAGEIERWDEIHRLLLGEEPKGSSGAPAKEGAAAGKSSPVRPSPAKAPSQAESDRGGFTVGSLLGDRRRAEWRGDAGESQ